MGQDETKLAGQGGTQAGAAIDVTPEMVEAGFRVLAASGIADDYLEADRLLVEEIYRAMSALSPGPS